jgi:predicted metal-binding membrane protein
MNSLVPSPVRDRVILLSGSGLITAVSWWYMIRMAAGHHHAAMDLTTLFVMWTVMMVAMMLPSTLPFVFAFSAEQRLRRARRAPVVPSAIFVAGCFTLWTAFSAVCALLQQFLHSEALLSPAMAATSSVLAGALLIAAGAYQWTPLKDACLRHCRSPFTLLLSGWRDGATGAFRMGASHGLFCIGCCWMLMLLPFAAGVMNLLWMAGLTVFLMVEKAAPGGDWIGRACGAVLALAGAYVLLTGVPL